MSIPYLKHCFPMGAALRSGPSDVIVAAASKSRGR